MKKVLAVCLSLVMLFASMPRASAEEFSVSAESAVVVNGETGEIIYGKNQNKKMPMASTTKILTALILCENCELEKEIKVTEEMVRVEGSSMGFLPGDTVSYKALLYGMMLPSGNDAATAFAIAYAGSLEAFSLIMNKRAAEIGLNNSHFVTPSGLDAKNHYSTAYDMAKLGVFAMKNETFKAAVGVDTIRLEYGNPPYSRSLFGHNKILGIYEGANGIKTGYTSLSGRCLVSSAERGNKRVVAVTLNDSNRWENHKKLLDFGFSNLFEYTLEIPENFKKIEVISGEKKSVPIYCKEKTVGLTVSEAEKLEYKLYLKEFIYAPQEKGIKVGRIDFYIKEKLLCSLSIKTKEDVPTKKTEKMGMLDRFLINLKLLIRI